MIFGDLRGRVREKRPAYNKNDSDTMIRVGSAIDSLLHNRVNISPANEFSLRDL